MPDTQADDIIFESAVDQIEVEPSDADKILARGMTPEAYYAKLQRASLFQGALTDAVPAVVEFASLLKEPWELVQAKLDLKKSKANEKGIPLDIQNARIDTAVAKTQQIVSQQSRAISDQLAMNPPPEKRKQLLAQQAKLAATVGVASAQVGAQVGVQSAEVAKDQLTQEHALEDKVAKAEAGRKKEKTGAFLKSFLSATNIWAATRAPADFGTHLLEEQTKFEGKAGKAGEKLEKIKRARVELEKERTALEYKLDTPIHAPGPKVIPGDAKGAREKALERYAEWQDVAALDPELGDFSMKETEDFQARQASQTNLADIQARLTAYNQKNASKIAKLEEQQAGFTQQAGVSQAALAQHQANPQTVPNYFAPGVRGGVPGVQPQGKVTLPDGRIFDPVTGTFVPPVAQ